MVPVVFVVIVVTGGAGGGGVVIVGTVVPVVIGCVVTEVTIGVVILAAHPIISNLSSTGLSLGITGNS